MDTPSSPPPTLRTACGRGCGGTLIIHGLRGMTMRQLRAQHGEQVEQHEGSYPCLRTLLRRRRAERRHARVNREAATHIAQLRERWAKEK